MIPPTPLELLTQTRLSSYFAPVMELPYVLNSAMPFGSRPFAGLKEAFIVIAASGVGFDHYGVQVRLQAAPVLLDPGWKDLVQGEVLWHP